METKLPGGARQEGHPGFYDQIRWPSQPLLENVDKWDKNVRLVRALCDVAQEVKWLDGVKGKDGYDHIPREYAIQGVKVEFLSHWGFYSVGGITFAVPDSKEDVVSAVQGVNDLARLGAEVKMVPQKTS